MLSKYHVPTGFCFSSKASGFYPFGDATDLAGEVGVGDVVWLIQATASNHKPKGRFFWYAFGIYKPKEPSLWFVVLCGLIEIRHATALTAGAKHWHRQKAVFSVFVSVPPAFIH